MKNQAIVWKDENLGAEFEYQDVRQFADQAADYQPPDPTVEFDDDPMEAYLEEGTEPSEEILRYSGLRHLTNAIVPIPNGTRLKVRAFSRCLMRWSIVPAPTDVAAIKGVAKTAKPKSRSNKDAEPFSALAFKIMTRSSALTFIALVFRRAKPAMA